MGGPDGEGETSCCRLRRRCGVGGHKRPSDVSRPVRAIGPILRKPDQRLLKVASSDVSAVRHAVDDMTAIEHQGRSPRPGHLLGFAVGVAEGEQLIAEGFHALHIRKVIRTVKGELSAPDQEGLRIKCRAMDVVKERIAAVIEDLGETPRSASIKAGLHPDTIGKILKPGSISPRADTLSKIAGALGVSLKWLMDGVGEPGEGFPEGDEDIGGIRYGGIVEAGAFRPNDSLNQDAEYRVIPISPDRRYPPLSQYAFEVVGDSMDQARMYPGMWLQAVDIHAWQQIHGEPRDGAFVIVAHTRNGDTERELTVKRLRIYRDRIELCPESSNPKHKPIVFPNPPRDGEGSQADVIAVVISSHNVYF